MKSSVSRREVKNKTKKKEEEKTKKRNEKKYVIILLAFIIRFGRDRARERILISVYASLLEINRRS